MNRADWGPGPRHRPAGGFAVAGVLMLLVGAWQLAIGSAIAGGDALVFSGGYWYRSADAGWGWASLAIGCAAILIGLCLLGATKRMRRLRAKVALTLLVAVVSAASQFFLTAQFPLWATMVIAADVFIVWAAATQVAPDAEPMTDEDDRIVRLGPPRTRRWQSG
ncbi:hypothetical protein GCM10027447_16220 [Glycomyces halotolerans]